MIGAWASGGAELAAYRGDVDGRPRAVRARRRGIGTNVGMFFPPGDGERLNAALGDEEQREPLLAGGASGRSPRPSPGSAS